MSAYRAGLAALLSAGFARDALARTQKVTPWMEYETHAPFIDIPTSSSPAPTQSGAPDWSKLVPGLVPKHRGLEAK